MNLIIKKKSSKSELILFRLVLQLILLTVLLDLTHASVYSYSKRYRIRTPGKCEFNTYTFFNKSYCYRGPDETCNQNYPYDMCSPQVPCSSCNRCTGCYYYNETDINTGELIKGKKNCSTSDILCTRRNDLDKRWFRHFQPNLLDYINNYL
ncbi:uncharacterized protein LOC119673868 [Teleopsis dalmanni]|uniref:uncharacterized protein LOC119673868 n=1 Tax=Teleopsis dalmanni TaxID=139649 RepID=UPI0018CFD467|nr:uncharacterized protein LOC119673868 [Teleopsis dalmanni]